MDEVTVTGLFCQNQSQSAVSTLPSEFVISASVPGAGVLNLENQTLHLVEFQDDPREHSGGKTSKKNVKCSSFHIISRQALEKLRDTLIHFFYNLTNETSPTRLHHSRIHGRHTDRPPLK